MKRQNRRTGSAARLLLAAGMLLALCLPASAAETESFEGRTGAITVELKTASGAAVPGGTLELCRVAEVSAADGKLSYEYTEAFSGCGTVPEDPGTEALAEKLSSYAETQGIPQTEKTVDTDGKAVFEKLPAGLYLISQQKAASGFRAVSPFLVSLPMAEENGAGEAFWQFLVDASPKAESAGGTTPSHRGGGGSHGGGTTTVRQPGTPAVPSTTLYPAEGPVPAVPSEIPAKLPQTGQLNWPVPVLAAGGVLSFAFGWQLSFGRKKDNA